MYLHFNVSRIGLKIIALHVKIQGKCQQRFKFQCFIPIIRAITPPTSPLEVFIWNLADILILPIFDIFESSYMATDTLIGFSTIKLCQLDCPSTFPQKCHAKFCLVKTRPVYNPTED